MIPSWAQSGHNSNSKAGDACGNYLEKWWAGTGLNRRHQDFQGLECAGPSAAIGHHWEEFQALAGQSAILTQRTLGHFRPSPVMPEVRPGWAGYTQWHAGGGRAAHMAGRSPSFTGQLLGRPGRTPGTGAHRGESAQCSCGRDKDDRWTLVSSSGWTRLRYALKRSSCWAHEHGRACG
jgi:hypothetical protein